MDSSSILSAIDPFYPRKFYGTLHRYVYNQTFTGSKSQRIYCKLNFGVYICICVCNFTYIKDLKKLQTNEIEICIYNHINIKSWPNINATRYKTSLIFHTLDHYF